MSSLISSVFQASNHGIKVYSRKKILGHKVVSHFCGKWNVTFGLVDEGMGKGKNKETHLFVSGFMLSFAALPWVSQRFWAC